MAALERRVRFSSLSRSPPPWTSWTVLQGQSAPRFLDKGMKREETRPLASLTDFQALSTATGGQYRGRRYDEFPANARGPPFSYEKTITRILL